MGGKGAIRLAGKKHEIPISLANFYGDLENLAEVETVGTGKFAFRESVNHFHVAIKYFNETTRTLKITAFHKKFIEDFYVRLKDNCYRETVEDYMMSYQP